MGGRMCRRACRCGRPSCRICRLLLVLPLFSVSEKYFPESIVCRWWTRSISSTMSRGEKSCLCCFYCWYFFNPSVLRPPPLYFVCQQNTGEECRNLSMASLYCFFSPSVLWVFVPSHLRWAGERSLVSVFFTAGISLTPPSYAIFCVAKHPVMLWDAAGEECRNLSIASLYCFFNLSVLWAFVLSYLRWAGGEVLPLFLLLLVFL